MDEQVGNVAKKWPNTVCYDGFQCQKLQSDTKVNIGDYELAY